VQGVQQVAACLRAELRLPDEVLSETTWYQLVYSLVRFPAAMKRSCIRACMPVVTHCSTDSVATLPCCWQRLSCTTWVQAAVGDLPRAHAAFARVRANGAWPMHKRGGMYFVNVLLDAYGADVDGAWRWCGNALLLVGPARQPVSAARC
jgi:hypothetical protein